MRRLSMHADETRDYFIRAAIEWAEIAVAVRAACPACDGPLRAAAHTPNGIEINQVRSIPVVASSRVFLALLHNSGATGAL